MKLVPIGPDGVTEESVGPLPVVAAAVPAATVQMYAATGFQPPWICYIAVANGSAVGTCGFKSAPARGRVEIAYFTFPAYEGKGIATQMARQLLRIAQNADPGVTVAAQTLPARNASHRVLEKLGFQCRGSLEHPEDGVVLEWHKVTPDTHAQ